MATVWEAVDEVLTRRVAVKILHPHLAADQQFVARFRREAIAVAGLSHPSIVSIYDTCSDSGTEAIVMELVRGNTLRSELDRRGRFEPADAVAVVAAIADALEAAHRAGIVHRDVKPANVLLSVDGRVLVADFGIAKAADGLELTGVGTTLGTAKYLAPEQVEGAAVDGRADVYAAGVILYELLCGRPPFVADHEAATALARLQRAPQSPRELRPELAPELEQVVLHALARDPGQRFATAGALRDALRATGRSPGGGRAPAQPGPAWPAPAPTTAPRAEAGATAAVSVQNAEVGIDPTTAAALDRTTAAPRPEAGRAEPRPAAPPASVHPQPASPAQPSRRRRRIGLGLTFGLVAASGLIAFALALQAGDPDGGDSFERDPGASGNGGRAVVGIATFDPPAGGGDGEERDEVVGAAIDDDPETAWRSECYRLATFRGLKDGVGLVLELSASASIDAVAITSTSGGWRAEVRVADVAAPTLEGWNDVVGELDDAPAGRSVIDTQGASGRFILVFFTGLGTDPDADCPTDFPFAVTVSDLAVDQD